MVIIAKVIPAVRLPYRAAQIFDYLIPERLVLGIKKGTVVAVPFSGRLIAGLVSAIENIEPNRPLKEIYGIIDEIAYPEYWVKIFSDLATEFCSTMPRFAWTAMPPVMRRLIATSINARLETTENEQKEKSNFEEKIICAENQNDFLKTLNETIGISGKGQALIIVPTVEEATSWAKEVPGATIFHSRLSEGEKAGIYTATAKKLTKVIIGTKSAVFLPFKDLRAILVLQAASSAHINEDLDPRYDSRIIVRLLAKAANAKLTFIDALPPISLGTIQRKKLILDKRRCDIFDLADAVRRERAKVLLCDETINALSESLAQGGRALLVLNRRGVGSSLVCKDCSTICLCESCQLPLLVLSDKMQCFACAKNFPLPQFCLKCNGTNFKTIGSGVKGLFGQLKKLFPESKLLLVESGGNYPDLDEYDLVVGTTAVFHALKPHFKQFDVAVDALLGAGTGRAGVYAILETARIIRELFLTIKEEGRLIIQTYDKTNPALSAINDLDKFIEIELNERKIFSYPPFSKSITLFGAGKNEGKILKEATVIIDELKKTELINVSDVVWNEPKLFRGKYRLKISAKADPRQNTDYLVKYLPEGWGAQINEL